TGLCESPSCTSGSIYNPNTGFCESGSSPCPSGSTLDPVTRQCISPPLCSSGTSFDQTSNQCIATPSPTSIPEFPFSFSLVIIFLAVAAVYLSIRQKMIPNIKRF
ncbi:MAG TPA: hypothetical protein VEU72_01995, partial [Nitrosopumilaceae archaeon]|nr:hypothetical protein [Nitrosopumilaceae archaeon]